MKNKMKKLLLFSVLLLTLMNGYSQYYTLEANVKRTKYRGAKPSIFINAQLGYQINKDWNIGLEYGITKTQNDIRMLDKPPTGTLADLISLNIYKSYDRSIQTIRAKVSHFLNPNFRVYAGPAIRFISVDTDPSDESTFTGSLFSDLEFGDHTNIGGVVGFDYIYSFNEKVFLILGVDLQFDVNSSSDIHSVNEMNGNTWAYGIGIGRRIAAKTSEKL